MKRPILQAPEHELFQIISLQGVGFKSININTDNTHDDTFSTILKVIIIPKILMIPLVLLFLLIAHVSRFRALSLALPERSGGRWGGAGGGGASA